jgi:hypothetical protein
MAGEVDKVSAKFEQTSLELEPPREVPFGLYAYDASNSQLGIPRYLFRVFSKRSAGQNDERWMKSLDAKYAKQGNLTDIFDRPDAEVAIALNEHLRKMYGRSIHDPFISWTASLAFALQYAIYKHRKEGLPMDKIHLCVIDTTDFPNGTFVADLVLMRVFAKKVNDNTPINVPQFTFWSDGGLPNLLSLRKTHYFGEYLAQGQLLIENRSFVVSCDKLITKDLLRLVPALNVNMKDQSPHCANATLQLRKPFYRPERTRLDSTEDITAIKKITKLFPERWIIVMFTSLLGLYPRRIENLGFVSQLLDSISGMTSTSIPHRPALIYDNDRRNS